MKKNSKYDEVEDIIIDIAFDIVNLQKEGSLKEYDIRYEDDGDIDNIKIIKKKDKYLINVNGIIGELKRDSKEYLKLMLKISEVMKLSEIDKINKLTLETN